LSSTKEATIKDEILSFSLFLYICIYNIYKKKGKKEIPDKEVKLKDIGSH
jgi:hypothetical protein